MAIKHTITGKYDFKYINDNIDFLYVCIDHAVEENNTEIADILSLIIQKAEYFHITPYNHYKLIKELEDSLQYIEIYEPLLKGLILSLIHKLNINTTETIALN